MEKGDALRFTTNSGAFIHQLLQGLETVKPPRQVFAGPEILANGDTDFPPADLEEIDPGGRLEISILIENIVGGEQRFANALHRLGAPQQSGRIPEWLPRAFVHINVADEERHLAHVRMQLGDPLQVQRDEARLEEKVLRRVPADRELRSDDELGALITQRVVGSDYLSGIPGKIADRGIDLSETDAHIATERGSMWFGLGALRFHLLPARVARLVDRTYDHMFVEVEHPGRAEGCDDGHNEFVREGITHGRQRYSGNRTVSAESLGGGQIRKRGPRRHLPTAPLAGAVPAPDSLPRAPENGPIQVVRLGGSDRHTCTVRSAFAFARQPPAPYPAPSGRMSHPPYLPGR